MVAPKGAILFLPASCNVDQSAMVDDDRIFSRSALKGAVVNAQMHGLLAELPMAQPSVNGRCTSCTSLPSFFLAKITLSRREALPSLWVLQWCEGSV